MSGATSLPIWVYRTAHLFTMDDKPPRCEDYVRDKMFAIDFDEKSVRVSRCLNLIAATGKPTSCI